VEPKIKISSISVTIMNSFWWAKDPTTFELYKRLIQQETTWVHWNLCDEFYRHLGWEYNKGIMSISSSDDDIMDETNAWMKARNMRKQLWFNAHFLYYAAEKWEANGELTSASLPKRNVWDSPGVWREYLSMNWFVLWDRLHVYLSCAN